MLEKATWLGWELFFEMLLSLGLPLKMKYFTIRAAVIRMSMTSCGEGNSKCPNAFVLRNLDWDRFESSSQLQNYPLSSCIA